MHVILNQIMDAHLLFELVCVWYRLQVILPAIPDVYMTAFTHTLCIYALGSVFISCSVFVLRFDLRCHLKQF